MREGTASICVYAQTLFSQMSIHDLFSNQIAAEVHDRGAAARTAARVMLFRGSR